MVIIEEWTGEEALEEHFATPHFKRVAEVLDEILVEPFAATTLTRLDVDQARPPVHALVRPTAQVCMWFV
jgi:hypothetical protein